MSHSNPQPPRRTVWSGDQVAVAEQKVPIVPAGAAPRQQPSIQLVRDHDRVRAVDVVCPCGQTIRVALEYDDVVEQEADR